jgi:hypothetical protein
MTAEIQSEEFSELLKGNRGFALLSEIQQRIPQGEFVTGNVSSEKND